MTLEAVSAQPDSETAFVWPFLTPDNRVGIDTIRLSVSDFEILPENSLEVYRAAHLKALRKGLGKRQLWFDKPLFTKEGGQEVVGALAFLKLKGVDTKPHINVQVRHGSVNQRTCTVAFSAPRIQHGNNFRALKLEELQQVLNRVQSLLLDAGIVANLQDASLSRLDIFRDLRVLWPLQEYAAIIEHFHLRYGKTRRFYEPTSHNPGFGLHSGNKRFHVNIYDKTSEICKRHKHCPDDKRDTIRFELQLRSGAKIQECLKIRTWRDLTENFEQLETAFSRLLHDNVFNVQTDWDIYDSALKWQGVLGYIGSESTSTQLSSSELATSSLPWQEAYLQSMVAKHGSRGYEQVARALGHTVLQRICPLETCLPTSALSASGRKNSSLRAKISQRKAESRQHRFMVASVVNPIFLSRYRELQLNLLQSLSKIERSNVLSTVEPPAQKQIGELDLKILLRRCGEPAQGISPAFQNYYQQLFVWWQRHLPERAPSPENFQEVAHLYQEVVLELQQAEKNDSANREHDLRVSA